MRTPMTDQDWQDLIDSDGVRARWEARMARKKAEPEDEHDPTVYFLNNYHNKETL